MSPDRSSRLNEDWTDYYDEYEGREPREFLLSVLDTFDRPGDAVDLGCGTGIETLAMLERGWSVFATDRQEEAMRRTRARVSAELEPRLRTLVSPMEQVEFPPADLVSASFSLFFCDPNRFDDVWSRLTSAIRPGGRFAGELLGDRDTWARQLEDETSSFTIDRARALFDCFAIERFDEEEKQDDDEDDPKWWHVFHVVARKP
jgi:SAM-dependent methyltransferase